MGSKCGDPATAGNSCEVCGPLKGADATAKATAKTNCEKIAACAYASDKCEPKVCAAASCSICADEKNCTDAKCSWTDKKCGNATAAATTNATKSSGFVKGLPVLSMIILAICLLAEF